MTAERSRYLAYLLRLWQVGSGEASTWRASVENAHTGERLGFAGLDDLFHFLRQEAGVTPDVDEGQDVFRKGDKSMNQCLEL